jgi:hypothetical protein
MTGALALLLIDDTTRVAPLTVEHLRRHGMRAVRGAGPCAFTDHR